MSKHLLLTLSALLLQLPTYAQQPAEITHIVAAIEKDKFHGWPANNGAWQWDDELLVGFTQGEYDVRDSHNIQGIQQSMFTRSTDGGLTWQMFDPDNFLDDDNIKWLPNGKKKLTKSIDFTHSGFAMRIFATSYHGNDDPAGGFYYSYDRGKAWNGPYFLGDINNHEKLKGKILSPRTDYIVMSSRECFIFISAKDENETRRLACIKTANGGLSFDFVAWVNPQTDQSDALMPCTIRLQDGQFLLAFRRINVDQSILESSIDVYLSTDRCQSWQYLSTVKEIKHNSNPPAMVQLDDGRVCCIYGDRDTAKLCGKYSSDSGKTWGSEFTLRDNYEKSNDSDDWADMGYPRLLKRSDGHLVAVYYWASQKHPQHYIEATIWKP
ncbi:MAG: sialidase family protein [Pirellulales bacterium]